MLYVWEWKRWQGLSLINIPIALSNLKVFEADVQAAFAVMKAQSTKSYECLQAALGEQILQSGKAWITLSDNTI
jgi:hypothetical protein